MLFAVVWNSRKGDDGEEADRDYSQEIGETSTLRRLGKLERLGRLGSSLPSLSFFGTMQKPREVDDMDVHDAVAKLKEADQIIRQRLADEWNSTDADTTRLREVVNARKDITSAIAILSGAKD